MDSSIKKRVHVFKNGLNVGGKVVLVKDSWEDFLAVLSQKLGIQAKRIFIEMGAEIEELQSIRDDEILYVSSGEEFESPEPENWKSSGESFERPKPKDMECNLNLQSEILSNPVIAFDFVNILHEIMHEIKLYCGARGQTFSEEPLLIVKEALKRLKSVKSEDMRAKSEDMRENCRGSELQGDSLKLLDKLKEFMEVLDDWEDFFSREREDSAGEEAASKTTDEPADRREKILNLIKLAKNRLTEKREVAAAHLPMPKEDTNDQSSSSPPS